jgi:hypothetical protein
LMKKNKSQKSRASVPLRVRYVIGTATKNLTVNEEKVFFPYILLLNLCSDILKGPSHQIRIAQKWYGWKSTWLGPAIVRLLKLLKIILEFFMDL